MEYNAMITKEKMLKKSPDIKAMEEYFNIVSDILDGSAKIKQKTTKYLPKFPEEQEAEYKLRLQVAKFTNLYRDVVEGLATKPFQNAVSLLPDEDGQQAPDEVKEFIKNVDGGGSDLTAFASLTFFNGINYALDWIFVDFPSTEGKTMTQAEAKESNLNPYWTHITAKNVLDVKSKYEGSKEYITYFKYLETTYGDEPQRVREYELDLLTKEVVWRVYQETKSAEDKKDYFKEISKGVLSVNFIPVTSFMTGRRDGQSFYFHPVMEDTANLQITLYQDESALQYTKMLGCYPMLTTEGKPIKDEKGKATKLKTGPNRVLYGAQMDNGQGASWKYVEPQANSLEFMKKDIDRTKTDLRELGRQPLTAQSSQLTTVTTSIAAGKAKSAVTAWTFGLQNALANALDHTIAWMQLETTYKPNVHVYKGFDDVTNDGTDVEALLKAREMGDLSRETLWNEFKKRNILSAEFNDKNELSNMLKEVPTDNAPDTNNLIDGKENNNDKQMED